MNNPFNALTETQKLELLQLSVAEVYNRGVLEGDNLERQKENKPANQRRAELIQRAREFVEAHRSKIGGLTRRRGYKSPSAVWALCDADFIVNAEKRTVVCLLREQLNKEITDKGIAKCMPDEVFNADIGRAIALARALEIDVPVEFLEAVQPDEVVIGHVVRSNYTSIVAKVTGWRPYRDDAYPNGKAFDHTYDDGFLHTSRVAIIDDTNAEYEVAS